MDQAQAENMPNNLACFCETAFSYHQQRLAIVTGAGGVSRSVASALVHERNYAVLLVSRTQERLNEAYKFALPTLGFSSEAARYGKVVGRQQLDLTHEVAVATFVRALARCAGIAQVNVDLIVHAAGRFAWDDKLANKMTDLQNENVLTKIVLAKSVMCDFPNVRQVFVGSVAATFLKQENWPLLRVQFPDGSVRRQEGYARSQEYLANFVNGNMKRCDPDPQVLLLQPGGMEDTETMLQFPPSILQQIVGHTVRTEVIVPLFAWLDGRPVATQGTAFTATA